MEYEKWNHQTQIAAVEVVLSVNYVCLYCDKYDNNRDFLLLNT